MTSSSNGSLKSSRIYLRQTHRWSASAYIPAVSGNLPPCKVLRMTLALAGRSHLTLTDASLPDDVPSLLIACATSRLLSTSMVVRPSTRYSHSLTRYGQGRQMGRDGPIEDVQRKPMLLLSTYICGTSERPRLTSSFYQVGANRRRLFGICPGGRRWNPEDRKYTCDFPPTCDISNVH